MDHPSPEATPAETVAVVGLGNVLMGDDGFGPFVVRVLEARYEFDSHVRLQDLGTPGLNLIPFVTDLEALLVVDTVSSSGDPGEIRSYRKDDLLRFPPGPRLNPHDPGLKEAILNAEVMDAAPSEVFLVGVVPEDVTTGTELSEPVQAAVEPAIRAVLAELDRLGVSWTARAEPPPPDLWWRSDDPAPPPAAGSV